MKSMIETATSLLNEDDHTTEVKDVKMLLEDNTQKLQLEPVQEVVAAKETDEKTKPKAPLFNTRKLSSQISRLGNDLSHL